MVVNTMVGHGNQIMFMKLWHKCVLIMVFYSLRLRNSYVKILIVKAKKNFSMGWRKFPIVVPLGKNLYKRTSTTLAISSIKLHCVVCAHECCTENCCQFPWASTQLIRVNYWRKSIVKGVPRFLVGYIIDKEKYWKWNHVFVLDQEFIKILEPPLWFIHKGIESKHSSTNGNKEIRKPKLSTLPTHVTMELIIRTNVVHKQGDPHQRSTKKHKNDQLASGEL